MGVLAHESGFDIIAKSMRLAHTTKLNQELSLPQVYTFTPWSILNQIIWDCPFNGAGFHTSLYVYTSWPNLVLDMLVNLGLGFTRAIRMIYIPLKSHINPKKLQHFNLGMKELEDLE